MADTIELMRQRVLDLAVKGKLVEQILNEGNADNLLKEIESKKKGEGKSIKDYKLNDKDGPFEIPKQWKWVRLGQVANFQNGHAFKSNSYSDEGVKLLRIGNIFNGKIESSTMVKIPEDIAKEFSDNLLVKPGDFVIAMSGATTGKLGFNTTNESFLLNQRVGKIIPINVNKYYIYYLLSTLIAENLGKAAGSAIPNLSTKQILDIKVPLPPLLEQQRIVSKIEEIFSVQLSVAYPEDDKRIYDEQYKSCILCL